MKEVSNLIITDKETGKVLYSGKMQEIEVNTKPKNIFKRIINKIIRIIK